MKLLALLSFEQKSTEKVELGSRKRLLYYLAKSNLKKNLAKEISIVQDIDSNTLSILTFRLKRFFFQKISATSSALQHFIFSICFMQACKSISCFNNVFACDVRILSIQQPINWLSRINK